MLPLRMGMSEVDTACHHSSATVRLAKMITIRECMSSAICVQVCEVNIHQKKA